MKTLVLVIILNLSATVVSHYFTGGAPEGAIGMFIGYCAGIVGCAMISMDIAEAKNEQV